jgi:uncharacterized protein (DUF2235 family)
MGKNIVICCDGTGNQYGKYNTNVVKLYERIVDTPEQVTFYDPGVGTSTSQLLVPLQRLATTIAQAFGSDLQRNVEDAYRFLMNTYDKGDVVFLFGFSRGAHTVRRLACMLEKCGLLVKGNDNQIEYVSRTYLQEKDEKVLSGFRKAYTRECPVHFVGVWDTVSAVSNLFPRPKLDGERSRQMTFGFHAVSIDEMRLRFPPNLWKEDPVIPGQTIEQVWFAGVHSDVGGSYESAGLSDIALKWMLEKGIEKGLKTIDDPFSGIEPKPRAKAHRSWIWHWWFIPIHVYWLLGLFVLLVAQLGIAYAGLFWPLPWRPFDFVAMLIWENWAGFLLISLLLIPLSQRRRTILPGAKVHRSLQKRYDKGTAPRNLRAVWDAVTWRD